MYLFPFISIVGRYFGKIKRYSYIWFFFSRSKISHSRQDIKNTWMIRRFYNWQELWNYHSLVEYPDRGKFDRNKIPIFISPFSSRSRKRKKKFFLNDRFLENSSGMRVLHV